MTKTFPIAFFALALASPLCAQPAPSDPASVTPPRMPAPLSEDPAWDFVEGLTTEVGPRLAGTEAEARARRWAFAWLERQGFSNVHIESFDMDTWVRGEERAEVLSPFAQPLVLTALGNSGATPDDGISAPVVGFADYAALQAAPEGSLAGKIAYIGHRMKPTQDGSGYGFAGPARWTGPAMAAAKGATAVLIRSIGTDSHRTPHTGNTNFPDGVAPIPAAALSNPDADNLERMLARGEDVRIQLTLTPRRLGMTQSGNLIAEVPGRDLSLPPVLLACHLDSWDLGTGAIDDGAGCGIIAAAAANVAAQGQPLRTIRLLFAGAEEVGALGGDAYAAAHRGEPVSFGLESDFGADRIWRIDTSFAEGNKQLHDSLVAAVAEFGVLGSTMTATGGADLGWARQEGAGIVDLQQDGTHYFDLHHTPDDTLDKIDPATLRQNVAVWTRVVGILASTGEPFASE